MNPCTDVGNAWEDEYNSNYDGSIIYESDNMPCQPMGLVSTVRAAALLDRIAEHMTPGHRGQGQASTIAAGSMQI